MGNIVVERKQKDSQDTSQGLSYKDMVR